METLTEICTCDDFADEPCPRHRRENYLQDEVIKLKNENAVLRDIIFGFNNHLLKMQADCAGYLSPYHVNCGKDWFVSRMIRHLNGPKQRKIQGRFIRVYINNEEDANST